MYQICGFGTLMANVEYFRPNLPHLLLRHLLYHLTRQAAKEKIRYAHLTVIAVAQLFAIIFGAHAQHMVMNHAGMTTVLELPSRHLPLLLARQVKGDATIRAMSILIAVRDILASGCLGLE